MQTIAYLEVKGTATKRINIVIGRTSTGGGGVELSFPPGTSYDH